MKSKAKVVRTCTYTVTVQYRDDNTRHMERINDGFHSVELLGYLDLIIREVREQCIGLWHPDTITRKVVVNK